MQSKCRYMYLLITQDEYEHVLDFDTSPKRLGERHGVSSNCVSTSAWHAEKDGRRSRFRRVRL